ncbi:hypothetical protein DH2020_001203 [Rehmannia glutinosa]|uniref:Protein kinase domain-containing protein n=1 Tax=Rehmannia glutinosa TaxID=99300 RepID=A0ABR0XZ92_REHGL
MNLTGEIPDEIQGLKSLNSLNLCCNLCSQPDCHGIDSDKRLGNNFSGYLPEDLGNATLLESLDLRGNFFKAKFENLQEIKEIKVSWIVRWDSREFGNLTNLKYLDLAIANLGGSIPGELGKLKKLDTIFLYKNNFEGNIPPEIGKFREIADLENLQLLNLMCNHLSGSIPIGIGKLSQLEVFELWNNTFSGPLPSDLGENAPLQWLDISSNSFSGQIPSSLCNKGNLTKLILFNNAFSGPIPAGLTSCASLIRVRMQNNRLNGTIPVGFGKLGKLQRLELANNTSGNDLFGEIPDQFQDCPGLSVLDLSSNHFTGNIPASIASIPENFGNSPALEMLNVSYNRLEGPVPSNAMLRTINPDDLIGNPAFFGARSFYQRWRDGNCFEERFETGNGEWPWRLMAFQRLDFNSNDILNCIKESNVIGMGATGTVYKAEIQRLNTTVAVKKLWRSPTSDPEMGSGDYFVGEVNLLGRLRHRNIVRLLGFLHNDADSMIIYEYMQNGSLGEALHGQKGGNLLVDWVSRYNIAVGVAQGLAYLHHDCHPPVIHRDVKSNNILLDANLEARIADFGLAKMMLKKNETVSMVAGSYGYIAPEYGYTLKVDEKSDIYSYGVVLMELLTGKKPLEPEFGESVDIVEWIRGKMRSNKPLEEALDPNVGNNKHVQEEMLLVLRFAIICTAKNPKDRPSMRDVLSMLGEAKPRRKSSTVDEDNNGNANRGRPVFSNSPVNGLL